MPHIIAYTYEAAMHCPDCTRRARDRTRLALHHVMPVAERDEHGLPVVPRLFDWEGNPVRPVFSTDEIERPAHCDSCRCEIDP